MRTRAHSAGQAGKRRPERSPFSFLHRALFSATTAGYYSAFSYYLALLCVNIPLALLETFFFIIIVYPLAGLHGGVSSALFGYCLLMLIVVNLVSRAWVLMLVSLMPTEALTNIFNGISLVIFSLFSGYLNPRETIPAGWIWSYYIRSKAENA